VLDASFQVEEYVHVSSLFVVGAMKKVSLLLSSSCFSDMIHVDKALIYPILAVHEGEYPDHH